MDASRKTSARNKPGNLPGCLRARATKSPQPRCWHPLTVLKELLPHVHRLVARRCLFNFENASADKDRVQRYQHHDRKFVSIMIARCQSVTVAAVRTGKDDGGHAARPRCGFSEVRAGSTPGRPARRRW